MPDISIVYKLHLECGKMINLYDWLQSFLSIVDPQDIDDDSKPKVKPQLQARFTQAVAELEYLGFIKSSKRKMDHVARLTWGG
jgi:origin recognition complex subunit 3